MSIPEAGSLVNLNHSWLFPESGIGGSMRRVFWSALIICLNCCLPLVAADIYQAAGHVASATFRNVDQSDVETFVYVVAHKSRESSPPKYRNAGSSLFYYTYRFDYKSGQYYFQGVGEKELLPREFEIRFDLSQATLNTTVEVDSGGQPLVLTVQLEFNAISDPTRLNQSVHEHSPDRILVVHYMATERQAEVTGSVLNGVDSLTPDPPLTALLYKASSFEAFVR
jgi:hypothetical protein